MSFLNPVNEPVLRFSSTDASAPQINYAARTAGDVKAVLKACLVTGYGAKASAGWTAVNEIANVIEFVSPNAAMGDYRLGIDDTSASSTTWYYQYQDARVSPTYASPTKSFDYIDNAHPNNGWQLLVTQRGILFVEIVYYGTVNKLSTRITYLGQIKSALGDIGGKNMMFFSIGHNGPISVPFEFYSTSNYIHANIDIHTSIYTSAATSNALSFDTYALDVSSVDLVSAIYIVSNTKDVLIGELPPILSKVVNKTSELYGVSDYMLEGRNVLSVCAGLADSTTAYANPYSRTFLIHTDYWEY